MWRLWGCSPPFVPLGLSASGRRCKISDPVRTIALSSFATRTETVKAPGPPPRSVAGCQSLAAPASTSCGPCSCGCQTAARFLRPNNSGGSSRAEDWDGGGPSLNPAAAQSDFLVAAHQRPTCCEPPGIPAMPRGRPADKRHVVQACNRPDRFRPSAAWQGCC